MVQLLIYAALLHPVHETVSEIEWNEKSHRLEVALRLDVLDEQWLRRQLGTNAKVDDWAIRYLQKTFRVAPLPEKGQPDPTRYHWIGRDAEGSHAWWYFEIEPLDRSRPKSIQQRMLFEKEDNFVNRILVLGQVPRRSLVLTIGRPRADLDQSKASLQPAVRPAN